MSEEDYRAVSQRIRTVERAVVSFDAVAEQVKNNTAMYKKLHSFIFGNGLPGLDENVRTIDGKVDRLEKKLDGIITSGKWILAVSGGYIVVEIVKFLLANI